MERREVFKGAVVDLVVDRVTLPNGRTCELELIRHPGASAVVAVDDSDRVLLVRQYRHATGGFVLEVPAGKLDGPEPPETCAVREVEEETGHRPSDLVPMGWIWTTPGFTDEKIWLFLATGLTPTRQRLQDDEVLSVLKVKFDEAIEMVHRGGIVDAKSICALTRARAIRNRRASETP